MEVVIQERRGHWSRGIIEEHLNVYHQKELVQLFHKSLLTLSPDFRTATLPSVS
jgi:hypothetical protein